MSIRNSHSAMLKLESRIRELETELVGARIRSSDVNKRRHKSERHIKEMQLQQEADRKNQDQTTTLVDKLQEKIHSYQAQVQEAEEVAALNLTKYRKAQQELEECEDRSKRAEKQLAVIRTSNTKSY